jgi:hypothetical protein
MSRTSQECAVAPSFLWNLSIAHYITVVRGGAESWKATASIPHGVTEIFHWLNPSHGVASASNRNEYWGYLLGVRRPVRRAHNLATIGCRRSWDSGSPSLGGWTWSRPQMQTHLILRPTKGRQLLCTVFTLSTSHSRVCIINKPEKGHASLNSMSSIRPTC